MDGARVAPSQCFLHSISERRVLVGTAKTSPVAVDVSQFHRNSAYLRVKPEIKQASDHSQIPCLVSPHNKPDPMLPPHCIVLKEPLRCWMYSQCGKSRMTRGSAKKPVQIPDMWLGQMLHEHFQLWLSTFVLQDKRLMDCISWTLKSSSKIYKKLTPVSYKTIQKY